MMVGFAASERVFDLDSLFRVILNSGPLLRRDILFSNIIISYDNICPPWMYDSLALSYGLNAAASSA